jgi:histidinol-phosphate aminotransferase
LTAGHRDETFRVDAGELLRLAAGSGADVVMLCSPNNPTGNAESAATVEQIAKGLGGLVIVDEAYAQFSPWSAVGLVADHPNVAVVRTFSKTWALAALRLGYLIADPAVADACWRVALPYHLDALKQAAGVAALRYETAMTARVARLVEERGALEHGLAQLPVDTWHSDANFILFRVRDRTAADLWQALVERSVLVRDVSGFEGLDGCLRVTVGTPEENRRFLAAMADVLASSPH